MDCREIQSSLDAFIDGELKPDEAAVVEAHLESCDDCEREFALAAGLSNLLSEGLAEEAHAAADQAAADGRFASIWENIEAQIAQPASREATAPGLWERARAWWSEQVRQPVWIPAAAAAAALAIIVALAISSEPNFAPNKRGVGASAELSPLNGPQIASENVADNGQTNDDVVAPRRRAPEGMVAHNEALIVEYEVDRGVVLIEQDPEEPDQPMVVWHIVDENDPNGVGNEG